MSGNSHDAHFEDRTSWNLSGDVVLNENEKSRLDDVHGAENLTSELPAQLYEKFGIVPTISQTKAFAAQNWN
jgi:hypothetical protein